MPDYFQTCHASSAVVAKPSMMAQTKKFPVLRIQHRGSMNALEVEYAPVYSGEPKYRAVSRHEEAVISKALGLSSNEAPSLDSIRCDVRGSSIVVKSRSPHKTNSVPTKSKTKTKNSICAFAPLFGSSQQFSAHHVKGHSIKAKGKIRSNKVSPGHSSLSRYHAATIVYEQSAVTNRLHNPAGVGVSSSDSQARVRKVYLSKRQTSNIIVDEKSVPGAPPVTPFPDGSIDVEYVPSMSDNMSKQQVKARLKDMKKAEVANMKQSREVAQRQTQGLQKEKEKDKKRQQRRIIYLLNEFMTREENERFAQFAQKTGLQAKALPMDISTTRGSKTPSSSTASSSAPYPATLLRRKSSFRE